MSNKSQNKNHHCKFCPSRPLLHCLLYPFAYLLLFDAFIDLGSRLLMGPKQTDDTRPLRVQNVPILIPNNLVQLQDPVLGEVRIVAIEKRDKR